MNNKVYIPNIPNVGFGTIFKEQFSEFKVTAIVDYSCGHDFDSTVSQLFDDIETAVKYYKRLSYEYINCGSYANTTVTLYGYLREYGNAVVLQSITDSLGLYFDYLDDKGDTVFSDDNY